MPPDSAAAGTYQSRAGERAGPFGEVITEEKLAAFRRAVGAKASVPPTFLTRYRMGEFELFERLGIPLTEVLHAEQTYSYSVPLRPGDELTYETSLAQALEKRGGKGVMHFLTFETRFESVRAGAKVLVGIGKTTIVVKGEARA